MYRFFINLMGYVFGCIAFVLIVPGFLAFGCAEYFWDIVRDIDNR